MPRIGFETAGFSDTILKFGRGEDVPISRSLGRFLPAIQEATGLGPRQAATEFISSFNVPAQGRTAVPVASTDPTSPVQPPPGPPVPDQDADDQDDNGVLGGLLQNPVALGIGAVIAAFALGGRR